MKAHRFTRIADQMVCTSTDKVKTNSNEGKLIALVLMVIGGAIVAFSLYGTFGNM